MKFSESKSSVCKHTRMNTEIETHVFGNKSEANVLVFFRHVLKIHTYHVYTCMYVQYIM